jgi:hypothetical protein
MLRHLFLILTQRRQGAKENRIKHEEHEDHKAIKHELGFCEFQFVFSCPLWLILVSLRLGAVA